MFHHGYALHYERFLKSYVQNRDQRLVICEVGILNGSGLAIWCDLFPNSRVIGLDIDISIAERNMGNLLKLGAFSDNSPELHKYDQLIDSTELLDEILNGDRIDIFIDDGAHFDDAIMTTMRSVLPHLSDPFVCFVEDNADVHRKLELEYPKFPLFVDGELTVITSPSGTAHRITADQLPGFPNPPEYLAKISPFSQCRIFVSRCGPVLVLSQSPDSPLSPQSASTLSDCLRRRYGRVGRSAEWPYWSHHPPKLIAENHLQDQYSQLVDYKWFCFQGVPGFVMVCKDRFVEHKRCFLDPDWNPPPFSDPRYPTFPAEEISPPKSLGQMRTVAEQLSRDFPFVRVDLYDIDGVCRFGELTPYPEAGTDCRFTPKDWSLRIGSWLKLPQPKINRRLAYSRFVV